MSLFADQPDYCAGWDAEPALNLKRRRHLDGNEPHDVTSKVWVERFIRTMGAEAEMSANEINSLIDGLRDGDELAADALIEAHQKS